MIDFLDFFNLQQKIFELSDNISDEIITNIIYDSQFEELDYDYDILYIISRIPFSSDILTNKTIEDLKIWTNNFISQINNLSKHSYSTNDILIFKKFLFYRLLLNNGTIFINLNILSNIILDINEVLTFDIVNGHSAWLAKEMLRSMLVRFYSMDINGLSNYQDLIAEQINIAENNKQEKIRLYAKLNNIKYDL